MRTASLRVSGNSLVLQPSHERPRGYSIGTLILAWVSGFSVGILTLYLSGFLLSRFGG